MAEFWINAYDNGFGNNCWGWRTLLMFTLNVAASNVKYPFLGDASYLSKYLKGGGSLLFIVQMPKGRYLLVHLLSVSTVAINFAALIAIANLGL